MADDRNQTALKNAKKTANEKFQKKYDKACTKNTDAIPCTDTWTKRTFGMGVPFWPKNGAPKKSLEGTRRTIVDVRAVLAGYGQAGFPWVPEGHDRVRRFRDAMPLQPHSGRFIKMTPEETRQAGILKAVVKDHDLISEIAKWEKEIKCAKVDCIGPEKKKERDLSDKLDVSEYAAWPVLKDTAWGVGACIKMEFKCSPPEKDEDDESYSESDTDDQLGTLAVWGEILHAQASARKPGQ